MSFRIRIRIERDSVPRSSARRRAWTLATATVVAGVLVTGVSYAFWSATGTGNATVGSATAQALGVVASSPVVADMYPGKAKQALTFTVSNNNPYVVVLNASPTVAAATTSNGGCPTSNLTITPGPYTMTGTLTVPASGSVSLSIANFVQLSGTALDACQGITFTFPVTVTGTQQ
jgi:hypothetical protein